MAPPSTRGTASRVHGGWKQRNYDYFVVEHEVHECWKSPSACPEAVLTTSGVGAKMPHPVMTKKVPIVSDRAPRVANQTQAVRCDNLVYVSGQIGCDPVTGILAEGLEAQTERMLANLDAVLAVANCSKENIVAVTMMFSDMQYFKRADEIYAAWSPPRETIPLPVRRAFASKHLPGGALVQIEAVAAVS